MGNYKIISAIVILSGLLLGGFFQNCSKVQFAAVSDNLVEKISSEGAPDEDFVIIPEIDDEINNPRGIDPTEDERDMGEDPDDRDEDTEVVVTDYEDIDNDTNTNPDENTEDHDRFALACGLQEADVTGDLVPASALQTGNGADSVSFVNVRGSIDLSNYNNVAIKNVRGDVRVLDINTILSIKNIRGTVIGRALRSLVVKNVADDVLLGAGRIHTVKNVNESVKAHALRLRQVKNVNGAVCVRAHKAYRVKNVRGDVKVFGFAQEESGARLGVAKNIRGDVYLNALEADIVKNVRGDVYLTDAKVKRIKNVRGNIYLKNSSITVEAKNIRGEIIEVP